MTLGLAVADLLRALRVLAPALARRQTRVYACELAARDDRLTIRTFDDTWEARYTLSADITAPGTVWLPSPLLRALPWAGLGDRIRLRRTGTRLVIESDAGTYTASTLETPATPAPPLAEIPAATLPGATAARLLRLGAMAAMGSQAPTPWVLVYGAHGQLHADAWDGRWLSRASAPAAGPERPIRAQLPLGLALMLAQAAAAGEQVTILTHPTRSVLTIRTDAASVTTRVLAGTLPDTSTLPSASPDRWDTTVSASALARAVRCALAVSGTDPDVPIRLATGPDTLAVTLPPDPAGARLGAFTTTLPASNRRPWAEVLSGRALHLALTPLGDAEVQIHVPASGRGQWITTTLPDVTFAGRIPALGRSRDPATGDEQADTVKVS